MKPSMRSGNARFGLAARNRAAKYRGVPSPMIQNQAVRVAIPSPVRNFFRRDFYPQYS
jgi:hypothetical protein